MLRAIIWLLVAVFSLAGLGVGSLLIFLNIVWWSSEGTDTDGGAGSSWMRERYHDGPRYFELTAKLEVEGTPVEITRVMECEPYFYHQFDVGYFQKRWYMTNDAMTHRLPDGSGVIIVVPTICNAFARPQPVGAPQWRAFPDFPDDFVPLIFWTADADNPEILEGYHSFAALNRPDSRVRFRSISLRNNPKLKPSPSPNEFGVMSTARYRGNPEGYRPKRVLNYTGHYLIAVEEEIWRRVPALDSALSETSAAQFLEPTLRSALNKSVKVNRNDVQYAANGLIYPRIAGRSSAADGVREEGVMHNIYGAKVADDALIAQTAREGVILYYADDPDGSSTRDESIMVGPVEITWPKGRSLTPYYEVSSGMIVELWRSRLGFYPLEN